jgi:hypothetical protein
MSYIGEGWTKYSGKLGKRKGRYHEAVTKEWYCQICGQCFVNEFPSYLFTSVDEELLKICPLCETNILILQMMALMPYQLNTY